jgi:hypothetical protein
LDGSDDQAERCRVEREANFMSGFRPRRLLLCLIAVSALIGAFGVRAGFTTEPGLRAAQAWLVSPSPELLRVTEKVDEPAAAYMWSATRIESGIRLRGSVPTSEDRRTVLGMVKAHFPDLDVEDRLKIADGAPPHDQWLGAVSFGLKQLSQLKRGSVRLLNVTLKLDGEARSAADYIEVKKALAGALPTGLIVANPSIRPPIADPFIFVADLGTNALSLSGSVPASGTGRPARARLRRPQGLGRGGCRRVARAEPARVGEDRALRPCRDHPGRGAGQGYRRCGVLPVEARPAGAVLHVGEHQLERGGRAAGHRGAGDPPHQGNRSRW